MGLDYNEIGRRIARRRNQLRLKQSVVEERADIGDKYLSNIECGRTTPSMETIMKLAAALDTTPDEFLVGASRWPGEEWKTVADKLRPLDERQLDLVSSFIDWVTEHKP